MQIKKSRVLLEMTIRLKHKLMQWSKTFLSNKMLTSPKKKKKAKRKKRQSLNQLKTRKLKLNSSRLNFPLSTLR